MKNEKERKKGRKEKIAANKTTDKAAVKSLNNECDLNRDVYTYISQEPHCTISALRPAHFAAAAFVFFH